MSASSPEDVQWINLPMCLLYPAFQHKSINDLILPPPILWTCSQYWRLVLSLPPSPPAPFYYYWTRFELFLSSTCATAHGRCVRRACVGIKEGLPAWAWGEGKRRTKREAGSSDGELWGVMEDDIMVLGQSCCGSPSPPQVCSIWHVCLAAVSQRKDRMFSKGQKISKSVQRVPLFKRVWMEIKLRGRLSEKQSWRYWVLFFTVRNNLCMYTY